jgi:tetratricopeptide (TPR) repeat protein
MGLASEKTNTGLARAKPELTQTVVLGTLRPAEVGWALSTKGAASNVWWATILARNGRTSMTRLVPFLTLAMALSANSAAAQREVEAGGWIERGKVSRQRGDNVTALDSFNSAIKSNPKNAAGWVGRADTQLAIGEPEKAIEDCNYALDLSKTAAAHLVRGNAQNELGEFAKALWDFSEARRLEPDNPVAFQNLAWLQATCPDPRFRNGREAVDNARKACELSDWKSAEFIDTLAAAHAELGEFEQAIKFQGRATRLSPEQEKRDYIGRLERYRAGQPMRMAVRPTNSR